MMIGNVSDAYNAYKIYPYTLGNDRVDNASAVSSSEECQTCKNRKYRTVPMKWFLLNRLPYSPSLLPEESVPMRANMFQMLTIKPHKKTVPWFMPLFPSTPLCVRNVEKLMFQAEQRIRLSAIRMRITHTRKTERPQMQLSFRGQILTLQSEVRKGDLLL